MLSKNILRIYALAVCFVSVIVFSVSAGVGIYDVVQINLPETTLSGWQYERYMSNENFTRDWPAEQARPDAAALDRLRAEHFRIAVAGEARDAMRSLIQQIITLLIVAALFAFHWKLSRNAMRDAP